MRWYQNSLTFLVQDATRVVALLTILTVTISTHNAAAFIPEGVPDLKERAPAAGRLLVASKDIQDPRFKKTVILLLKHDSNGTLGLIINKPSKIPLSDIFTGQKAKRPAATVFFGGPVQPVLFSMLVKTQESLDDKEYLLDNVYSVFGTQRVGDAIGGLNESDKIRVYSGYAGWSSGQLDSEIRRGGWHVAAADPALIFSIDPEKVWQRLIRRVGGQWT